jgi:ectoine hydroxylase-related dioxygenase (phytanoyl-CoA dioxygenase family)
MNARGNCAASLKLQKSNKITETTSAIQRVAPQWMKVILHQEKLPMKSTFANVSPFIETDTAADSATLRVIMKEQGYLFFRGLLPEEDVLAVRHEVLQLCNEAGWLDASRNVDDGIAAPGQQPLKEGMPEYMPVYRKVLKLPSFHDFPTHPQLMQIARQLIDGEVLVHPRRIGRITFPHFESAATPPHQDHHYIRGAVETYSCWIPLGDCPMELGGLAVEPGSHRQGFLEHSVSSPGVGGKGVPVDEEQTKWHSSDFIAGDALFFHAYTIHKALPNTTNDRLRISTDNRYQREGDAIDPGALKPHFNLD